MKLRTFFSKLFSREVMFSGKLKDGFGRLVRPLVELFATLGLRPDFFTTLGLLLSIGAAAAFAVGWFPWAGILVLVAGLCDVFDGQVARAANKGTRFGALLDSTLDRYSEAFIFFGIALYLVRTGDIWTKMALLFALAGSLMVSYVRARAEGLGIECQGGLMQRTQRTLAVALGALFGKTGLIVAIWLVAVLANYTVVERIYHVWTMTKPLSLEKEDTTVPG